MQTILLQAEKPKDPEKRKAHPVTCPFRSHKPALLWGAPWSLEQRWLTCSGMLFLLVPKEGHSSYESRHSTEGRGTEVLG